MPFFCLTTPNLHPWGGFLLGTNMDSKQVDNKNTKQIRIDSGWHKLLKIDAAKAGISIRELVEACLSGYYAKTKDEYELVE